MIKTILFLTGTRADFGKLKTLMTAIEKHSGFKLVVFITGMHMLSRYGSTYIEVEREKYQHIYKFINQNERDSMDIILSKTINGLSDLIKESPPDMIVVHGDRVEAMAGAIVGSLNNILVAHIEGGEVSGTIDELIRHSVTKLSHFHFVCNDWARKRLEQLGEKPERIHVIGSPDIDVMASSRLPTLAQAKKRYDITFDDYAILLLHPVTTEIEELYDNAIQMINALKESGDNCIVIYPNNDLGNDKIFSVYKKHVFNDKQFLSYPSLRFEYFLTLLKNSRYIIGNSSAGVREAPFFGVPTVNVGSRQENRVQLPSIINVDFVASEIIAAISLAINSSVKSSLEFGDGKAWIRFVEIISEDEFWQVSSQKKFVDI